MKKIFQAFGLLVAIYALNWVATVVFDAYGRWVNFDVIMHTLGGIGAGWFGLAVYELGKGKTRLPEWMRWVCVMGIVTMLATGWEWHEYAYDTWRGGDALLQVSIADTMLDMLLGFVGGLLVLIMNHPKGKER